MQRFKRLLESPYLHLVIGILLLITSVREAWSTLSTDIEKFDLRTHHSIGVFGLVYALKSLAEVLENLTKTTEELGEIDEGSETDEAGEATAPEG